MQLTTVVVFVVLSLVQFTVVKSQQGDIVQTLFEDGQYRVLLFALADTGLIQALRGPGPFTLFAPTDRAFEKLPRDVINDLFRPQNRPELTRLLEYHAVEGKALTTAEIIAMIPPFKLKMVNNATTEITENGGRIKINNATIVEADVRASNGVIQAIDDVLFPPRAVVQAAIQGSGPFTGFQLKNKLKYFAKER